MDEKDDRKDQEVIELSNEARDRLFEVMDDPDPRPNAALVKAAEDHERLLRRGS